MKSLKQLEINLDQAVKTLNAYTDLHLSNPTGCYLLSVKRQLKLIKDIRRQLIIELIVKRSA